jgi:hypothetical protein
MEKRRTVRERRREEERGTKKRPSFNGEREEAHYVGFPGAGDSTSMHDVTLWR